MHGLEPFRQIAYDEWAKDKGVVMSKNGGEMKTEKVTAAIYVCHSDNCSVGKAGFEVRPGVAKQCPYCRSANISWDRDVTFIVTKKG